MEISAQDLDSHVRAGYDSDCELADCKSPTRYLVGWEYKISCVRWFAEFSVVVYLTGAFVAITM